MHLHFIGAVLVQAVLAHAQWEGINDGNGVGNELLGSIQARMIDPNQLAQLNTAGIPTATLQQSLGGSPQWQPWGNQIGWNQNNQNWGDQNQWGQLGQQIEQQLAAELGQLIQAGKQQWEGQNQFIQGGQVPWGLQGFNRQQQQGMALWNGGLGSTELGVQRPVDGFGMMSQVSWNRPAQWESGRGMGVNDFNQGFGSQLQPNQVSFGALGSPQWNMAYPHFSPRPEAQWLNQQNQEQQLGLIGLLQRLHQQAQLEAMHRPIPLGSKWLQFHETVHPNLEAPSPHNTIENIPSNSNLLEHQSQNQPTLAVHTENLTEPIQTQSQPQNPTLGNQVSTSSKLEQQKQTPTGLQEQSNNVPAQQEAATSETITTPVAVSGGAGAEIITNEAIPQEQLTVENHEPQPPTNNNVESESTASVQPIQTQ